MSMEKNAAYARADAALTALASRCLLQPTMELAQEVQSGMLASRFGGILAEHPGADVQDALAALHAFQEETQGKRENDARLMLETDYNRLFVAVLGKLLAVPYDSFYKPHAATTGVAGFAGPSEREVVAFYGEHGYEMPEHFVDFADHIAIELEFLAMMASAEADAWEAGDIERAEAIRRDADAFRREHPASFIVRLAADIRAGAKRKFYPAIATIVEQAVLP